MRKLLGLILSFIVNFVGACVFLGFLLQGLLAFAVLLRGVSISRTTEEIIFGLVFLGFLTIAFFVNRYYYKNDDRGKVWFVLRIIISLTPYFIVFGMFQHMLYIASGI